MTEHGDLPTRTLTGQPKCPITASKITIYGWSIRDGGRASHQRLRRHLPGPAGPRSAVPHPFAKVRSSWTGRSGTASTDQLFVPKGKTQTDATITLNLNGTRLLRIDVGTRPLIRGVDYTVSGNTLTIAAATLSRLTASQEYGTNAVLSLRFADGIPWTVNVITYDKPVLTSATGTTASLVIPTAFNGDKLATMEAVYADGTAAGPQSWRRTSSSMWPSRRTTAQARSPCRPRSSTVSPTTPP